jgi:hypothetical protein
VPPNSRLGAGLRQRTAVGRRGDGHAERRRWPILRRSGVRAKDELLSDRWIELLSCLEEEQDSDVVVALPAGIGGVFAQHADDLLAAANDLKRSMTAWWAMHRTPDTINLLAPVMSAFEKAPGVQLVAVRNGRRRIDYATHDSQACRSCTASSSRCSTAASWAIFFSHFGLSRAPAQIALLAVVRQHFDDCAASRLGSTLLRCGQEKRPKSVFSSFVTARLHLRWFERSSEGMV